MRKTSITLIVLLILTNIFWVTHSLDVAVALDHTTTSLNEYRLALSQALSIIKSAAPGASRDAIMTAAQIPLGGRSEVFEKDGLVWIGRLGLRFSPEGKLQEAISPSDPIRN